jgi:hypothetical protein
MGVDPKNEAFSPLLFVLTLPALKVKGRLVLTPVLSSKGEGLAWVSHWVFLGGPHWEWGVKTEA